MNILIFYRHSRFLEMLIHHSSLQSYDYDLALSPTDLVAKAMLFRYNAVIIDAQLIVDNTLLIAELTSHNHRMKIIVYHQESTDVFTQLFYRYGAHMVKQQPLDALNCFTDIEQADSIFSNNKIVRISDLILDHSSRKVCRGGQEISLRNKEFSLLACLMEHVGVALSRDFILEQVWDRHSIILTNTVDVHIYWLRQKIDSAFAEKLIKTIPCIGYMIEPAVSLPHADQRQN